MPTLLKTFTEKQLIVLRGDTGKVLDKNFRLYAKPVSGTGSEKTDFGG